MMEEKKEKVQKKLQKDPHTKETVPEAEEFIKNPEADTEDIVDFMHEEIKKRPMNRKKLFRRAWEVALVAVIFGFVSCIVFAVLLPVINNVLYPEDQETRTVTLPEATASEELSPEDMVENERKKEESEEKERLSGELEALLDEKILGVEQQKRISAALQELAAERAGMIATVSGITSDTDWFNDAYENRDTASGLVTKKTDSEIFVLVQSRRIADAQRIMVTFHDGTEAEASVAGSDVQTGLTVLSVPLSSVPAGNRDGITEAVFGSSGAAVLTGAPVIAIGSPTGTAGSVIYGNVTAAEESLEIPDNHLCRFTTDIYGSSDATGFFINLDGAVVGMIEMRYRDENVPNMLCAIGISELRQVIRRMENGGQKAYLGICGMDVTEQISEANDIPVGVWVTRVEEDSPAMAAGIQKGDIIVGVGDTDILYMSGLALQLGILEPGDSTTLRIMRLDGSAFEEIQVPVTTQ